MDATAENATAVAGRSGGNRGNRTIIVEACVFMSVTGKRSDQTKSVARWSFKRMHERAPLIGLSHALSLNHSP